MVHPQQQSVLMTLVCKFNRTLPPRHRLQLRWWGIHPLGRQPVQETTCYETKTVQKPSPFEPIKSISDFIFTFTELHVETFILNKIML